MTTVWVVPGFNPSKDRQARFGVGLPDPPVNQLTLQSGKEAFCHGVVISIAHGSHARAHAHFFAEIAKRHTGVLAALVGMVNHRFRLARE